MLKVVGLPCGFEHPTSNVLGLGAQSSVCNF
jgi:hypothetical protein